MEQERRVVSVAIDYREATDQAPDALRGYAAVFNTETVIAGLFREVIRPEAFTDAVSRDDVRALFNHDPNFVLGRTAAGTLTISVDGRGLKYEVTPPNTTWAKDLVTSVKRGDVTQSSFAFRVTKDSWPRVQRDEMPLRQIEAVELFDVSPVTYPAYESTTVAVRATVTTLSRESSDETDRARQAHARKRNRVTRAAREVSLSQRS